MKMTTPAGLDARPNNTVTLRLNALSNKLQKDLS